MRSAAMTHPDKLTVFIAIKYSRLKVTHTFQAFKAGIELRTSCVGIGLHFSIFIININLIDQTEVKEHMARISGVDLPREKRIEIGLTYVYGISRVRASKILEEAGVNPDTRVKDLTDEEVAKIAKVIDADPEHLVEGDLRREVAMNIKRLKEIGCYRGIRHRKGLPCRGQKTKTNARTCKGPKKTVANKKK